MPRRKNPVTTAVEVGKGAAAIGKMVVGQVGRTALTAAGGVLAGVAGAVGERAGRRQARQAPAPTAPANLRAVPKPVAAEAAVKAQGDPVAPVTKYDMPAETDRPRP